MTAWSLLGSHSWNTLLTAPGEYEPGVFDVSSGKPRPTALAALWRGLPLGAKRHPVASETGWWRRPERLIYQPLSHPAGPHQRRTLPGEAPLLICGATGTLGRAFARACARRGISHFITGRDQLDLERLNSIADTLDGIRPWGVVNATGWVRVDEAEAEEVACHRANAAGAIALAEACADRGIVSLGFSSDLVFDGTSSRPYVESDQAAPLNAYGRSKAAMEAGCAGLPGSLVARTAAFFSPHDPYNFAWAVADTLAGGRRFAAAADHVVTPTYVPTLVEAALDLLIDGSEGIWHLSSGDAVSWAEFAERVALACGLDASLIDPVPGAELGWQAPRPRFAAVATERGTPVGRLDACIEQFAYGHRAAADLSRAA